jgi:DNA end-binding protein Ku
MRSMWKGAVSFGLVMIPVKLYTATEQKDIAFRQVHREDGGRIRFRRFCTIDEQEVPYEDIAKGYELPDGQVIVLTEDDMAELPLPTTKSIEVVQFCPSEQLDPILFNRSYYVEPEAAGVRAYCLLRDALEESGKIAIAQVALRQRESLAVLRARDGVLVLETLLWPDEVREAAFPFVNDPVEVRPQELRMASSLIESMTVDFDPDEFHDHYREALQELVAAKMEGREIMQPEVGEVDTGEPSSLADALRASLAAAKGGRLSIAAADGDEDEEEAERPAGGRATARKQTTPMKPTPAKSGSASAGVAKASTAKTSAAKTSAAKTSAAKTSGAMSGTTGSSTAKPSSVKSGTARQPAAGSAAKPAPAKPDTAKSAAAKSKTAASKATSTRGKAAAKEPEAAPRPRRRAG